MSLPILLNHRPRFWRTNPGIVPIKCWSDRKKTVPIDISGFGDVWRSQVRESYDSALVATFDIEMTSVSYQGQEVSNGLELSLSGGVTAMLDSPYYVFDVEVTGGSISPLTIFLGGFMVEGDVTRPVI